jgi:hypothetical protein
MYRFCFSPGIVAGLRLYCLIFVQHARSGGSSVMVVFVYKDEPEIVSEDLFFQLFQPICSLDSLLKRKNFKLVFLGFIPFCKAIARAITLRPLSRMHKAWGPPGCHGPKRQ